MSFSNNYFMRVLVAWVLVFVALVLPGQHARGVASLIVTNNNDSGDGSLRQVIALASADNIIKFDKDYTISLLSELTIDKNLTIDGEDHLIMISGSNKVRVFLVAREVSLNLDHLTVTEGAVDLGAGLYNNGGLVNISNSTFIANNSTTSGGGVFNVGVLTITNSTFLKNGSSEGGAIFNDTDGSATITSSTIVENSALVKGGGLRNNDGRFELVNTILANNLSGNNCSGTISDGGGNLVWGDVTCPGLNADPVMGAAGDYGGPTQTYALLPGSAAIHAASSNCPTTDQRGFPRSSPGCDSGAFEVQAVLMAVPLGQTSGMCQGWADACELSYALSAAVSGHEIWAAAGTYKPTPGTDRAATFQLKEGVDVYGGFAGTETARRQRDPAINLTVLSGDIDNNDSQTPIITNLSTVTGNDTNSETVVTGVNDATLDGFTITAGYASGIYSSTGGGMSNFSSSPALTNVTFSGNWAATCGGGLYNYSSNPVLTNVTFSANLSAYDGGGMYNHSSNPILTNVTFSANLAYNYGGGLYNVSSNPVLTNVTFNANSGYNGAGMYNFFFSSPVLTNVTFSSNSGALFGGGMFNSVSSPTIRNTIFWGNTASSAGAQIYNSGSTVTLSDSVVQAGCPEGSTCTNIISSDPLLGPLGDNGGFTQTISLQFGSSAIDTGNDLTCASTDQRGRPRPLGAHCDIGAYELQTILMAVPLGQTSGFCQSWAEACELSYALSAAVSDQEIWAAAGTYKPTALTTNRLATFQLKEEVAVYGGFAGTETARSQRDPVSNQTVLSGDIDNNDSQTPIITNIKTVNGNGSNSYHVVKGINNATLDGFTITAGYADGTGLDMHGGGMYNLSSSPMLENVIFSGNWAYRYGGGMYNEDSSPTVTNVIFSANSGYYSGGMANNDNSNPVLMNVTFTTNSAIYGGGMFNDGSSPTLTNVTFSTNFANSSGGGMYNQLGSNSTLTNVTFSANSVNLYGGGMYNLYSDPTISNTIFWDNTAGNSGAQIYISVSTTSLSDSVVQAGCPEGGICTNIISSNPLLGPLGDNGGFTQTIPLQFGSSAIDTGNDLTCASTDQRGITRPQGWHCDIGAYEFIFYRLLLPLVLRP